MGHRGVFRRRLLFAALALLIAQIIAPLSPLAAARAPATVASNLVAIPQTPLGEQLLWTLDRVNQGGVTTADVKDHVAGRFLTNYPAKYLIGDFKSLGSIAPMVVGRF